MLPIPIRTDYRMTHRPWINYAIIAANVALYFLGYNGAHSAIIDPYMLHADAPQLVQFVSCVFLHANFMHLAGNMLFLWVFGNAINDRFGHVGYLAFYLAGGILACVGYLLLSGGGTLLGASGAISAVTGAYLVLLPRVRIMCMWWLFYVLFPFEVSSLVFLALQFGFNLAMSLTELGGDSTGVAYAAHSSGYIFGAAVALLLLLARVLPRDPFDLLSMFRSHQRRQRFRGVVAQGYDPFGKGGRIEPGSSRWINAKQVETAPPTGAAAVELDLRRQLAEAFSRNDLGAAVARYRDLLALDPDAVLSRQHQVDLANFLMSAECYQEAADAYERLLRHYPNYEHLGDIYLLLGILYRRYLNMHDKASNYLKLAMQSLTDPRKIEMARHDLEAIAEGD